MTYLSKRLLVRILHDRWNSTTNPPKSLLRKWLNEILDEEELLPSGQQAVLNRATAEDKRDVIKLVKERIEQSKEKHANLA